MQNLGGSAENRDESVAGRVAVVFGTRPEAIKMAPVYHAFRKQGDFEVLSVHSGQHREMVEPVIELFALPVDVNFDVMKANQGLAGLTARLLERADAWLEEAQPDLVLVQGDTTTVLAMSLAAFYRGIPVGHVEAGLRTGNLRSPFPEEANRVLASRIASLHFAPTPVSRENLAREGVAPDSIEVTGNTVIDALFLELERQKQLDVGTSIDAQLAEDLDSDWRAKDSVLVTGHRRENFGSGFDEICDAIAELADAFPEIRFIYPVHLNPNVQRPVQKRLGSRNNIRLLPPQPYPAFVRLMAQAKLILTDSGGVQEEAPSLGKPVLVMRDTTERPEGVDAGTVRLVGAERAAIVAAVSELLTDEDSYRSMSEAQNPYGDGHAADRIVERTRLYLGTRAG